MLEYILQLTAVMSFSHIFTVVDIPCQGIGTFSGLIHWDKFVAKMAMALAKTPCVLTRTEEVKAMGYCKGWRYTLASGSNTLNK